ncbi:hypothetical protein [Stomatohabitans albus]|uniref:hypothetical protein n=1 Tax=Stomatohabitans albus TaxID=3110766 RepID=UPI00300CA49C
MKKKPNKTKSKISAYPTGFFLVVTPIFIAAVASLPLSIFDIWLPNFRLNGEFYLSRIYPYLTHPTSTEEITPRPIKPIPEGEQKPYSGCRPGDTTTLPNGDWYGYADITDTEISFDLVCYNHNTKEIESNKLTIIRKFPNSQPPFETKNHLFVYIKVENGNIIDMMQANE